ncbi:MAG: hypothetical protein Q9216_004497 [Gyalolechia sp. 2 TL-2023]
MTCLITGASFNLDGYYHGVIVEPFFMPFDGGDNNNGITIIDITDLESVRYCFVDFYGMESAREVELMTPLSARTYLEAYYILDELDEKTERMDLISLLEKFRERDVVTVAKLKETWPDGEWQKDGFVFEEDESDHADCTTTTTTGLKVEKKRTEQTADDLPGATKSLRDHSMNKLMEEILDPGTDNPDLIASLEILNDFIPKLRCRLYERAATLQPTTVSVDLLHKAMKEDVEVDLSVFKNFAVEDLAVLVAKLRGEKMRVLNLSNMLELSEADLQLILGIHQASSKEPETGCQIAMVGAGS